MTATTLVVGATGATGRWLVRHLLASNAQPADRVRVIVRAAERLPDDVREHPGLEVVEASVLELSEEALHEAVQGCRAVASCLGHTLNLRGVFGAPRRLVTESVRRLTAALLATRAPDAGEPPARFVLMSTVGVRDPALSEPRSLPEQALFGALRHLLPPHADNEQAAVALRKAAVEGVLEWCAVRPDSLVDLDVVTPYTLDESLRESPLFGSGKTSRINVAHFMAELITDAAVWARWRGRMPVITGARPEREA